MKGIFLFCTKLKVYLIELPLMLMLGITIRLNGNADDIFKFYPLIIILSLGIIFIAIYFFRGVFLTVDEISDIGLFSKRESELIKKEGTLVLTIRRKGKMNIDLWDHSDEPAFDWMKKEDDPTRDVRVYHRVAIAGRKTAVKILGLFGVDSTKAAELTEKECAAFENDDIKVTNEQKHDCLEIRIRFLKAVI